MRIGVDFGGTKIEAARLAPSGEIAERIREPNPGDYDAAIAVIRRLVERIDPGGSTPVGVGLPGSPSPHTGVIRGANSIWLNGRLFRADLASALGRPVRIANDANCFALSEATDGAAAGAASVFGVIVGTGVGGGVVLDGELVEGVNGVAGEWGHTPLPWPTADEYPGPTCWCGRRSCLELWVSGKGFEADYARNGGSALHAEEIGRRAAEGEAGAAAALARYADRLGRGLAVVCDIVDPAVIVLGGGMSNVEAIYAPAREALARALFSDVCETTLVKARFGDSSGVRGAAWLWTD